MIWCDNCDRVIQWNSEEIVVPYKCPTDNKMHRYYTDFYVKVIDKGGALTENIIEIKPFKETRPPIKGKNKNSYIKSIKVFLKNQAKWKAAKHFATNNGMNFFVLTENDLILPTAKRKNGK